MESIAPLTELILQPAKVTWKLSAISDNTESIATATLQMQRQSTAILKWFETCGCTAFVALPAAQMTQLAMPI
jgi:hypothetical protein